MKIDRMDAIKAGLIKDQRSLQAAYALREEVFVVEQKVAHEEEFDEFEEESHHFLATIENKPVGAARWRVTDEGIKLERFAVGIEDRGKGVGKALVEAVLDHIDKTEVPGKLYLHAQLEAVSLYAYFGFKIVGEQFTECEIEHRTMELIR